MFQITFYRADGALIEVVQCSRDRVGANLFTADRLEADQIIIVKLEDGRPLAGHNVYRIFRDEAPANAEKN